MQKMDDRNYSEESEWKKFGKEDLKLLYENVSYLHSFRSSLESKVSEENSLKDVLDQFPNLRSFLLGGIDKKGEYRNNSLAKLFRYTLGIYIKPKRWVSFKEAEGVNATEQIKINFQSPSFLEIIKHLEDDLEKCLKSLEIEDDQSDFDLDHFLENENNFLDTVKEVYERSISMTPVYNPFTFFVYSLNSAPIFYVREFYSLNNKEANEIKELLGIGIKEFNKPNVKFINYQTNSTGEALLDLIQTIHNDFESKDIKNILDPLYEKFEDNPKKELEKYRDKVLEDMDWEKPEYFPLCSKNIPEHSASSTTDSRYGGYLKSYIVENGVLSKKIKVGVNTGSVYDQEKELDEPISLSKLIPEIAPALFFGRYSLSLKSNEFRVVRE